MTDGPLSGRTTVITGGARGIGLDTALRLAAAGAEIAICSRTRSELEAASSLIEEQTGKVAVIAQADVRDAAAMVDFAAAVAGRFGTVDLLVNNAAVLGPVGALIDADLTEWLRTFEVNLGGVASPTKAVVPHMTGGGCIINLSGGGVGGPSSPTHVSAYTASKAAVVQLTETLARELHDRAIRVNAIAPGAVTTRFMEPVLAAGPQAAGGLYATTVEQRGASTPLGPFFELISYLASDDGAWVTGRFLSARWDPVAKLVAERERLEAAPDMFTLRRIDGDLYDIKERGTT